MTESMLPGFKPRDAKPFYRAIAVSTFLATANFIGLNPMKVLVWSGMVQGFSAPPLMLFIMLMTSNPAVMGKRANSLAIKFQGGRLPSPSLPHRSDWLSVGFCRDVFCKRNFPPYCSSPSSCSDKA
jgi:Natural resistance-associated macrophage protein